MKTLLKRFFTIEDRVIGPSHDPYSRHIVRMIERFSDGAERRVILQICGLAGTSLEVASPEGREVDVIPVDENGSPLLRKFEQLVGVPLHRIEKKHEERREERFAWRIDY